MPPRHVYWTIIVDGKPTAFRAHSQDELLPTLRQLQTKHPDAVMKWFARGKLWDSQEEERAASRRPPGAREQRGRGWRPGGEHKDPRDRFKVPRDVKRQRFAARQRRDSFEGRGGPWGGERSHGGERPQRPWSPDRRPGPTHTQRPGGSRVDRPGSSRIERPGASRVERPGWKPRNGGRRPDDRAPWNPEGRPRDRRREREWSPEGGRPRGPQGDRTHRREWNREERPRGPRDDRRDWKPGGSGFGKPGGPRRPGDGRPPDRRPPGGKPDDRRPSGGRPPGGRPSGGRPRGPGGGWRKPGGRGNKGGGGRGR